MKKPLSKTEYILAITAAISILLFVVAGVYIVQLRQAQSARVQLLEGKDALLRQKDSQENETANYIETICAEYRKLYQTYRELRSQNSSVPLDKYVGLPGSAKGQIDECYLPD